MGWTDAPGWTLPFHFYRGVGRLISGMASTGQYGLVGPWRGLRRQTRDGPSGRVILPDHQWPRNDWRWRRGVCFPGHQEPTDMCMVPVGLRARKLFHHWEASRQCFPQGYTNGIIEGCRPWLSRCWDRGIGLFRTLRSGCAGARHRWSPQCPELGDLGGGCGLQGGIAGLRRNWVATM